MFGGRMGWVLALALAACGSDGVSGPVEVSLRLTNVSDDTNWALGDGATLTVGLAPGAFVVTTAPDGVFAPGQPATAELETLAEQGDPSALLASLSSDEAVSDADVVGDRDNPDYRESPIGPGGEATFTTVLGEGETLVVAVMLGPSNDTFLGTPEGGLTVDAVAEGADLTGRMVWWDAGTEVDEPLGEGSHQPSVSESGAGEPEGAPVGPQDDLDLPGVAEVVRLEVVTVSAVGEP